MSEFAKHVMIINKWEESRNTGPCIVYRIACSCGTKEHDLDMWVEFDKEFGDATITFYYKVDYFTNHQSTKIEEILSDIGHKLKNGFVRDVVFDIRFKIESFVLFYRRMKDVWKLLRNKELKLESDTILYGEESIENFIKAILEGLNFIHPEKQRVLLITTPTITYTSGYTQYIK